MCLSFSLQLHNTVIGCEVGSFGVHTMPSAGCTSSYAGLDLPGMTGTSPPLNATLQRNLHSLDSADQRNRQLTASPQHQHEFMQHEQRHYARVSDPEYIEASNSLGRLFSMAPQTNSTIFSSTDTDHDVTLTDKQFSDKFLLIQQQQLLIQEKREQLKQLKEQRRRSLLQSPNSFLNKSDTSSPRDVPNSLLNPEEDEMSMCSKQITQYYNGVVDNHSGLDYFNDGSQNLRVTTSLTQVDPDQGQQIRSPTSQTYQNFTQTSSNLPQAPSDVYVYAALKSKKNVYSSIPDGNNEMRTSTVVPSMARQNESVV